MDILVIEDDQPIADFIAEIYQRPRRAQRSLNIGTA
jgi:hypothetical protein